MKEADGKANAAGNMMPAASAAAPVASAVAPTGARTAAAAPLSLRASSPAAPVEEEKTEEAPAMETSTAGKMPAEEEASTAGKTPTVEEETFAGQAGVMAAPPPEAPGTNNTGACAIP
jgi:hypothetical protein